MKTKLTTLTFTFLTTISYDQNTSETSIQNISTYSCVVYGLFATNNMYNSIKLNTRNGILSQIQWSTKNKYRLETILSEDSLVNAEEEKNGRFFFIQ